MRKPTQRVAFGQKTVEKLRIPKTGRVTYYDTGVRELGLRIENGRKTFFWFRKVAGRPTFKAIGTFPATSVSEARGAAQGFSADLEKLKRDNYEGMNPFERPRGEPTLGELLDDYIDRHLRAKAKRPEKAEENTRWMFGKYLAAWRDRKLSMIRRRDVLDLHDEIGKVHGHHTANRVVQLLRALFYFAEDAELSTCANPARKIKLFAEKKRKRFVQADEMPRLFVALRKDPSADLRDYVLLSLWTGARRSDVWGMRWQDVSLADNKWEVSDPKTEAYTVPLTPEAIKILKDRLRARASENPWVFPSFGKSGHVVDLKKRWRELLGRAGIVNLRQHDLRRTLASWQAKQGASLKIISESLGHESTGVTEVYARLDLQPIRESVTRATQAIVAASKKKPKLLPAVARG